MMRWACVAFVDAGSILSSVHLLVGNCSLVFTSFLFHLISYSWELLAQSQGMLASP